MATFKVQIRKDRQREDKSFIVFIRFSHNRRTTYLPTTMIAEKKDLTSSLKIKNQRILDRGEELIRSYRKKLETLYLEINDMPFEKIVERLKEKDESGSINFVSYARTWLMENEDKKGIKNYTTALNAFCRFMGRDVIYCNEFSEQLMKDFENYLNGKARAQSLYTSAILKIYNDARDHYNDYDNGNIRIKASLRKYTPPKQNVAVKRALSVENIRTIMKLTVGEHTRAELAKDCFIMSFCLMGINAVDLYSITKYDGEKITYNRTKTRDRRSDQALMVIDVPAVIKPIMKKYMTKCKDGHIFNFSSRYSKYEDFNRALNIGLKDIARHIGVDNIQFYSARHSMATIAANDVRIPIYIVNDMLCHIDERMKITNLYIKKDFSAINEANSKLIDYVFGKQKATSNEVANKDNGE